MDTGPSEEAGEKGTNVSTAPETITEDELARVMTDCMSESARSIVFMGTPGKVAAEIFAEARRNREPRYERGRFYQDRLGQVFFRVLGDGDGWSLMPEGKPYPHDYPQRPLCRLVPEGPQEPPAPAVLPVSEGEEVVQPGEMYQDRIGQCLYRPAFPPGWLLLPEGTPVPEDCPAYPLRRLIPEGPHPARLRIADIADIIAEYTDGRHAARAADRICKLLEAGS
jgi:hypothetical protein